MIDFLKDHILLFVLIIAGDWVSLSALIKAEEIRHDAIHYRYCCFTVAESDYLIICGIFLSTEIGKKYIDMVYRPHFISFLGWVYLFLFAF